MTHHKCPDPVVRAVTLVHIPGALTLATIGEPDPVEVPLACLHNRALLVLLPPGSLADAVRGCPDFAGATGSARSAAPGGGHRRHAELVLGGTIRAVTADEYRDAALALCDVAPREELLAADRAGGRVCG